MNLIEFINEETGLKINESDFDLRIEKDLGIYGDEAFDLINKFSSTFDVSIKKFEFNKYFNNEQDKISRFILSIFIKMEKQDLTILDLKNAIEKKELK